MLTMKPSLTSLYRPSFAGFGGAASSPGWGGTNPSTYYGRPYQAPLGPIQTNPVEAPSPITPLETMQTTPATWGNPSMIAPPQPGLPPISQGGGWGRNVYRADSVPGGNPKYGSLGNIYRRFNFA